MTGEPGAIHARIVEASRDGIWVFDPEGRTVYANPRIAELLGRSVEEMLGTDVRDHLDEEGRAQFTQHLADLAASGPNPADVECVYRRADGTPVDLMVSETALREDDGTVTAYAHRLTHDADRRALLHELSHSRAQLDEAQALAHVGSWELDFATDQMTWSRQMYAMIGVDPETWQPSTAAFLERVLPADREVVNEAVSSALETGHFAFDARVVRADGSTGWVRGLGRVTYDEDGTPVRIGGTTQEITDIKEAELKLLDAVVLNSLMQVMATAANEAESLHAALVVTRGLLLGHEDWLRGVGFSVVDGEGLEPLRLTPEDPEPDAVEWDTARRAVLAGGTVFEQEARPQTPSIAFVVKFDDQPRVVVVITAASPFERHEMLLALCDQVADQLGRVAERERAAEQLAAARDAAMEASRLKSEFLATMSHEIRTPLNGVIGLNELLQRTDLTDDQRRLAEGVQGAGRSLLGVINDILDFSKIEAGELELEEVDFEVRRVFEQAWAILAESAHDKGIELSVEVEEGVPARLVGDPTRLGQVLSNLLSNAIKFTSFGRVVVRAYVDARDDDEVLLAVEVSDTGIGIRRDQLERLFEPFRQADASTTRTFGGTGLGLAISRQLVTAIGGDIGVRSEPGEGSTFWFTARYRVAGSGRPGVRRLEAVHPGHGDDERQGHVLLVEDNEVNQLVAVGFLETLGYSADVAGNGEEAVTMATRAPTRYDAVLMDLQMPVLDGFAATRLIRAAESAGRRVPIIAMTASAFEGEREKCLAAGMDDFLTKPVDRVRLSSVLRAHAAPGAQPLRDAGSAPALPEATGPAAEPAADGTPLLDPSRIEELLEMGEGTAVLVKRAVDNFVSRTPETLAELHAAVVACDAEALRAGAHKLKGSALNLGALRVAEVSLALEELGREGSPADGSPLLEDLEESLHDAAVALQPYH
jgi:PAS domain S-box-containing protein